VSSSPRRILAKSILKTNKVVKQEASTANGPNKSPAIRVWAQSVGIAAPASEDYVWGVYVGFRVQS